eukprot:NODE_9283_length_521_cov_19.982234_g9260_i0.p1 GENE.NODE_9283_length_521_cov_19.982234_g9260_i0~~NODE_9283_length_521_cov_19.982234_g9260_i0.p1  ORF type:complete len:134 (+),score=19.45 NODE_9283_length_521_cov_19.982234_g9260_i0:93-494(+)
MSAQEKRTLYCGGLADEVDDARLRNAFEPFGIVLDVNIPLDQLTQKNKGFGFLEFELAEDAAAALENMNGAELFNRVLRVNLARPTDNTPGGRFRAVWETHADKLADKGEGPAAYRPPTSMDLNDGLRGTSRK